MSAPPLLPALPGQGWSVHKRPLFSTRVASHVSGREVRTANWAQALYEFELRYDGLAGGAAPGSGLSGLGAMQQLLGFVLSCQGRYGTFLYVDPADSVATGQPLGTGDGVTASFPLVRALGGATEPVGWATSLAAAYVDGAAQPGASLAAPATLTFASPPPAGASVAADFTYAFPCRFTEDAQDFENVMAGLWQLDSLKFRSVRS